MLNGSLYPLKHAQALFQCLCDALLLVDNLPEAVCFDRSLLGNAQNLIDTELNYHQRLGHLYEDALEKLILSSKRLSLLEKGMQIFDENKRTLGELDFLLQECETGAFIHLELVVKFYLIKEENGKVFFPGPDPRDNWLNKLQRLRMHQLNLAQTQQARKIIEEKFGCNELSSQHLIYGKLFDHYRSTRQHCPPSMAPHAQRGTWKYLSEWIEDFSGEMVTVIPKHLWSVEIDGELLETLESCCSESFRSEAEERCVLIWNEELECVQFIVPDTWG